MDDFLKVLKQAASECSSESVTYSHRVVSNCFLGRDLVIWLAKTNDKNLLSIVMSNAPPVTRRDQSRASKVLEAIQSFLQKCVDLKLLVGVNKEEKMMLNDVFYTIRLDPSESSAPSGVETDKALLDCVEVLKRKVEVKDRRAGFRSIHGFLAADAKAALQEKSGLFDVLVRENLIAAPNSSYPDILQFVPRVVHSGYVHVSVGGGTFARKWVVLREKSVIVFAENRKLQQFEIEMTAATCEMDNSSANLSGSTASNEIEYRFVLTTAAERIVLLTYESQLFCVFVLFFYTRLGILLQSEMCGST
jgi:hypothetical protein